MKVMIYTDSVTQVDASRMHVLLGQLPEQSLNIDSLFPQLASIRAKARIDGLKKQRTAQN